MSARRRILEALLEARAAAGLDARDAWVDVIEEEGGLVAECSDPGVADRARAALGEAARAARWRVPDGSDATPAVAGVESGVVVVAEALADLRAGPSHRAELRTQAPCGARVTVLGARGDDWRLVRLADGYVGWMAAWHLVALDANAWERWRAGALWRVAAPMALVRESPAPHGRAVVPLPGGTALVARRTGRAGWRGVTLADGRAGFVRGRELERAASGGRRHRGAVAAAVCRRALACLGVPYRWGGTSPWGFDCSGLVHWAYGLEGVALPRDADRQAAAGAVRPPDPARARPGDLVFFGPPGGGITHVAIALGGGDVVHAHGRVRVDRVAPGATGPGARLAAMVRQVRDPLARPTP